MGAISNRYLDFVQMRGLISMVNDNHVDNSLNEISVQVYYGPAVNIRPKMGEKSTSCIQFIKYIQLISLWSI